MEKKRIKFIMLLFALLMSLLICAPCAVYASQKDITKVISAIDSLPAEEDLDVTYADLIERVYIDYSQLVTAEKIYVTNSEKLIREYDKLVQTGALVDIQAEEENAQKEKDEQRTQVPMSEKDMSQQTSYTLDYDPEEPVSVVVRYTTDTDGNGSGDAPSRVILTSPHADTYPVVNTSTKLTTSDLTVGLSWEVNFFQIDFAQAESGKWTITTSIPCTFSLIEYAGPKQDIPAEDNISAGDESIASDSEKEKQKEDDIETTIAEKESSRNPGRLIIGLIVMVGLIVVLAIFLKKMNEKANGTTTKKEKKEEIIPRQQTDEEIMEEMYAEYHATMEKKWQMEEADEAPRRGGKSEGIGDSGLSSEDYDNDETIQEYTEGDTGLLTQRDAPKKNKQAKNSFFDEDGDFEDF